MNGNNISIYGIELLQVPDNFNGRKIALSEYERKTTLQKRQSGG